MQTNIVIAWMINVILSASALPYFKEINTFIQENVKLIKSDSKELCHKYYFFNKCIWTFYFCIKESWNKYHGFHKNMKQHNCFQHW